MVAVEEEEEEEEEEEGRRVKVTMGSLEGNCAGSIRVFVLRVFSQ